MWCTVDIVKETRPNVVVWENVKNLLSKTHRHNFDSYLRIMDELGYNSYYKVLNAKDYGIPQNRERIYTISIKREVDRGYNFPEKQELKLRLKDILELNVDKKYYLSNEQVKRIYTTTYNSGRTRIQDKDWCATLCARDWKDPKCVRVQVTDQNELTPMTTRIIDEPIIAASRGRNIDDPSNRTAGVPTEQRLEINKQGVSNTITTVQKDNYVIEPCSVIKEAMQGDGRQPSIATYSPYVNKKYEEFINENHYIPEMFNPYNKSEIKDIAPTLTAQGDSITKSGTVLKRENLKIRKLTPKECWRLMGFDDEDFEKAESVPMSNTQLYKQAR